MISNRTVFCMAAFILSIFITGTAYSQQHARLDYKDLYNYIANPNDVKPLEHIIVSGNPLLFVKGKVNDVKTKFELCSMSAAAKSRPEDTVVIFIYGEKDDIALKQRIENYRGKYKVYGKLKFIIFSDKNEFIEYLKSRKPGPRIGSISFFTHSFKWGLTIGKKDFQRREKRPQKDDPFAKTWFQKDPQHLYPENFRRYMPKDEWERIKNNLTESTFIAIFGCNTALFGYTYEESQNANYVLERVDEPIAQGFANIFNAAVLGTDNTTLFQVRNTEGAWQYVNESEDYSSPIPMRMVSWEMEKFRIIRPDPEYKDGNKSTLKLKARPYKLFPPEIKFRDIWDNLSNSQRKRLNSDYEKRVRELKPLYDTYENDFSKLSEEDKSKYFMEEKHRTGLLKKYSEKEREFTENKSMDIKRLNRWRLLYQRKIQKLQKDLGIPLTYIKAK